MPWFLWLIAAAGLGVAEFFTLTLTFGLLAAAAVVAAVVAGIGAGLLFQLVAFGAAGALGFFVILPFIRDHVAHPPLTHEGSDALVGTSGVVLQEVTHLGGMVKLSGEEWSARALDESQAIPAGTMVDVVEIEGATAIVFPREIPWMP